MEKVRVLHYLNQFFTGVGGEDKADIPPNFVGEAIGPGKRLQALLGESVKIVGTAYCGDDYFADNSNEVLEKILEIAKNEDIEMVIAGPAFASGRYGFACEEICHFLSRSLDIYCITGMHPENPGASGYKEFKDEKVFLIPTAKKLMGIEDALSGMSKMALKLISGIVIRSASEEGYLPRGIRMDSLSNKSGAERAVNMLLNKLSDRSFETEIKIKVPEEVPAAPAIVNLKEASIAIISTAGVHPLGNPYGFKVYRNTQFRKYDVETLITMKDGQWEVVHGGYNAAFMNENPNFGVPLDACRELEKEGAFSKLQPYFYGTTGVEGLVPVMKQLGKEIGEDMKAEGVNAALLVST